jgi:hypothetical protein
MSRRGPKARNVCSLEPIESASYAAETSRMATALAVMQTTNRGTPKALHHIACRAGACKTKRREELADHVE